MHVHTFKVKMRGRHLLHKVTDSIEYLKFHNHVPGYYKSICHNWGGQNTQCAMEYSHRCQVKHCRCSSSYFCAFSNAALLQASLKMDRRDLASWWATKAINERFTTCLQKKKQIKEKKIKQDIIILLISGSNTIPDAVSKSFDVSQTASEPFLIPGVLYYLLQLKCRT